MKNMHLIMFAGACILAFVINPLILLIPAGAIGILVVPNLLKKVNLKGIFNMFNTFNKVFGGDISATQAKELSIRNAGSHGHQKLDQVQTEIRAAANKGEREVSVTVSTAVVQYVKARLELEGYTVADHGNVLKVSW